MTGHICSRAAYQRQVVHREPVCAGCRAENTRANRGRGVGRSRVQHPQPAPPPDLRLYPIIDLLARLLQ